jgi:hypothetical protein
MRSGRGPWSPGVQLGLRFQAAVTLRSAGGGNAARSRSIALSMKRRNQPQRVAAAREQIGECGAERSSARTKPFGQAFGSVLVMATPEQEIIGDALVGDVKWRVTLSHGLICLWTDDADTDAPRYVFSATIPPEALQLAVEAARRHAANSPMPRPSSGRF